MEWTDRQDVGEAERVLPYKPALSCENGTDLYMTQMVITCASFSKLFNLYLVSAIISAD